MNAMEFLVQLQGLVPKLQLRDLEKRILDVLAPNGLITDLNRFLNYPQFIVGLRHCYQKKLFLKNGKLNRQKLKKLSSFSYLPTRAELFDVLQLDLPAPSEWQFANPAYLESQTQLRRQLTEKTMAHGGSLTNLSLKEILFLAAPTISGYSSLSVFGRMVEWWDVITVEFVNALGEYLKTRCIQLSISPSSSRIPTVAPSPSSDNPMTLAALPLNNVILELGSGNGRLAFFLNKLNIMPVKVIATDIAPPPGALEVEALDYVEAVKKYRPRIVLIQWHVPGVDWTDFLRRMCVDEYVLMGETFTGTCGLPWETFGFGSSAVIREMGGVGTAISVPPPPGSLGAGSAGVLAGGLSSNGRTGPPTAGTGPASSISTAASSAVSTAASAGGQQYPPFLRDGYESVYLDTISQYQINRGDFKEYHGTSRTVSFRRCTPGQTAGSSLNNMSLSTGDKQRPSTDAATFLTQLETLIPVFTLAELKKRILEVLVPNGHIADLQRFTSYPQFIVGLRYCYQKKLFMDNKKLDHKKLLKLSDPTFLPTRSQLLEGLRITLPDPEEWQFGNAQYAAKLPKDRLMLMQRCTLDGGSVGALSLRDILFLAVPSINGYSPLYVFGNTCQWWDAITVEFVLALAVYLRKRCETLQLSPTDVIVEVGAGMGRLAHFLNKSELLPVKVIATDVAPITQRARFHVEALDYIKAIQKYKPPIVLCQWHPPGIDFTQYWRSQGVSEYLLIGELSGTCGLAWDTFGLDIAKQHTGDEVAPFFRDGYEVTLVDEVARHQINVGDFQEHHGTSRTVSFRRLPSGAPRPRANPMAGLSFASSDLSMLARFTYTDPFLSRDGTNTRRSPIATLLTRESSPLLDTAAHAAHTHFEPYTRRVHIVDQAGRSAAAPSSAPPLPVVYVSSIGGLPGAGAASASVSEPVPSASYSPPTSAPPTSAPPTPAPPTSNPPIPTPPTLVPQPVPSLKQCGRLGCSNAESTPLEFKTCARCKQLVYCSPSCQKQDWKRHKPSCSVGAPAPVVTSPKP